MDNLQLTGRNLTQKWQYIFSLSMTVTRYYHIYYVDTPDSQENVDKRLDKTRAWASA